MCEMPAYLRRSDPVGIQTQDLQNRNLTLYSAKLRSQSRANLRIIIGYCKCYSLIYFVNSLFCRIFAYALGVVERTQSSAKRNLME